MSSREQKARLKRLKTKLNAAEINDHEFGGPMSPSPNAIQPINWHDNVVVPDVQVPWLYEAHSAILLAIVLIAILYCTLTMPGSPKLGLQLVIFQFIAVGCLTFPAGPLIRPHPILWRFLFTVLVIYCFFIVYLLAQEPEDARKTLALVFDDPSLGIKPPERNYAVDCRFLPEVIWGCCDRFIFAHFLGWVVKGMILRHRGMCWVCSVGWELIELSTKWNHLNPEFGADFIPNFAECWWDHLILDLALCNALGIEVGLWIASKWHEWDPHGYSREWFGPFERYTFSTLCLQFERLFVQFTPLSMTPMYWEPLSSFKRWFAAHVIILIIFLIDFNGFVLKLYLYIPTEHPINVWRLMLGALMCVPASSQFYLYITHKKCKKMGSFVWIGICLLTLELALAYKCAPTPFPSPPKLNKILWTLGAVVYLFFMWTLMRDLRHVRIKQD